MTLNWQDFNDKVVFFFNSQLSFFGPQSAEALAWTSQNTQFTRFSILSQIAPLNHCSLLDVGSGLGDLYGYLKNHNQQVDYNGIELSSSLAQASLKKYPGLKITQADFLTFDFKTKYDYVFCSGSLNALYPDHLEYLNKAITKMFSLCTKGIAFNLLSGLARPTNVDRTPLDIELAYIDPADIIDIITPLTHKFVIRHDYLDNDFTVYLYK